MIIVINFRKNGNVTEEKKTERTQAQNSVQLKIMFGDILIAHPSEVIRRDQLLLNLNT